MRQAMSIAPGLIVTLALFFLMQFMIAGGRRDVERLDVHGGVGLVTLKRASVGEGVAAQRLPLLPEQPAQSTAPPSPPELAELALPNPDHPDMTAELPAPEMPTIDALPFLGGPPVVATARPTPPLQSKEKKKAPSKAKRSERETTAGAPAREPASASAGKRGSGAETGGGGGGGSARGGGGSAGSGDRGLAVLSRPKPSYPREAAQRREEGWVKVAFTVTESGTVTNAKVVAAKPRRVFDRSALSAIQQWRFKPKMVAGKPVRSQATQLIEFNLASR